MFPISRRYIDDIFMTWNKSEQALKKLLNEANQWHPNMKFEYKISQSLPFLDVNLTNRNGILHTSVYHKPSAEPYVVPYLSDHHPHVFRNIIQTLLTRAVRYSSTFELFDHERRFIKLMLLYNGYSSILPLQNDHLSNYYSSRYPSTFIDDQFERFFSEYIDTSSFLPYIADEHQFILAHRKILNVPTPRQSQVALSAAIADMDNNQTADDHPPTLEPEDDDTTTTVRPEAATVNTKEQRVTSDGDKLFIHYIHEKRFRSSKRQHHRVYQDVFQETPAIDVSLIVANRNRRNAKNELIHKKPKLSLLQNQAEHIKNKYIRFLGKISHYETRILYILLIRTKTQANQNTNRFGNLS